MNGINRNGFERVRLYVLGRLAGSGIGRITTAEIGEAAGISRQTAHDHLQMLIDLGILTVVRRSVYSLNIVQNITQRASHPDKGLTNRPLDAAFLPPQPDVDLTGSFKKPDRDLTNCPNRNNEEKEDEDEKENLLEHFGKKFFWGVSLGNGILREGVPATADDLDDFVDWQHPSVVNVTKYITSVFNTNEYRWSPNLTKRLVFGVLYGMAGFTRDELKVHAAFAKSCVENHHVLAQAIKNNDCFKFKENRHPKQTWQLVSWYVNARFEEHGIKATPCEPTNRYKSARRALAARLLPGFGAESENKPPLSVTPAAKSPATQQDEGMSHDELRMALSKRFHVPSLASG